MSRRNTGFVLLLAFTAFVLPKLAVYADYRYTFDDAYHMGRALDAMERPGLLIAPDYTARIHPLFLAVLGGSQLLFGPSALPLGILLLFTHLGTALLIGRLAQALGLDSVARLVAVLLFLFFSTPNRVFADVGHLSRTLAVLLAVAGLLALARHAQSGGMRYAGLYLLLFAAALMVFEDPITTPAVGIVLCWALSTPLRRTAAVHAGALGIAAGWVALTAAGGSPASYGLGLGAHVLTKLIALPRELAVVLLLPHGDLLGRSLAGTAVRLLVGAVLVAAALWSLRPAWTRLGRALLSRPAAFSIAWIAFAVGPFMLRPTGHVWHSRYLYVAGAGLALLAATLTTAAWPALGQTKRRVLSVAGVCLLVLNAVNIEYMVRKIQSEWDVALGHEQQGLSLARALNRQPPPAGSRVLVVGAPLSEAELGQVCRRWVLGAPECQSGDFASDQTVPGRPPIDPSLERVLVWPTDWE